jgi:hypothetical protein
MRHTITELELLAIVETLHEYKCILLRHLITIYTNHKNLTFLNFTTNCITHWQLIVEEYGPNIVYLPGKCNIIAMLSLTYQNLMNCMMNQHFLKKAEEKCLFLVVGLRSSI